MMFDTATRHCTTDLEMPSVSQLCASEMTKNVKVVSILDAVKPMLAKPIKSSDLSKELLNLENWIYEEKYDGERLLVTCRNEQTLQIRQTRFLKPLTSFQHNVRLNPGHYDCIFDGELVFHDRHTNKIVSICETGSRVKNLYAKYIIFDIQYHNGVNVRNECLLERKKLLHEAIESTEFVRLSEWHEITNIADLWKTFHDVCERGGEGLMLKRKDQEYMQNKRKWLKLKPMHLENVRAEYELFAHKLTNDHNGLPGIIECGYYKKSTKQTNDDDDDDDKDTFVKVCSVSSGINGRTRNQLEQLVNEHGYFKERQIVTVIADKITIYKHLRHPTFKCIRFDLNGATTKDIIDTNLLN